MIKYICTCKCFFYFFSTYNIDLISIYSVKSTNFTESTYKSICIGTRLLVDLYKKSTI